MRDALITILFCTLVGYISYCFTNLFRVILEVISQCLTGLQSNLRR